MQTVTPRPLAGAAIAFSVFMLTIGLLGFPGYAADQGTPPPAAPVEAAAPAPAAPAASATTANALGKEVLASPDSAKAAEITFVQNCAYCHGNQGSGGKARTLQCRELEPDYLFDTISNGRKRGSLVMPPWKDSMDERTRWQLTAYILSLKTLPSCPK